MFLITIIILLIIIVYLYNQLHIESRKDNYVNVNTPSNTTMSCSRNCGQYNIDVTSTDIPGCLSCGYCGVCTLPNKTQVCVNGDASGSYFNVQCSGDAWQFGTKISNPNKDKKSKDQITYEDQLKALGQRSNLPSQTNVPSYLLPPTSQKNMSYNNWSIASETMYTPNINLTNQNLTNQNLTNQNLTNQNLINQDLTNQIQQLLNQLNQLNQLNRTNQLNR
jgi:hypothetical protein